MIFWDTSAFVRGYATGEPGYGHVRSLLLQSGDHAASLLLRPEATGAVTRRFHPDRARVRTVLDLMQEHLREFVFVGLDPALAATASRLASVHRLRGADAVHLASALTLRREIGRRGFHFVTADHEQAAAGRSEGLRVVVPRPG